MPSNWCWRRLLGQQGDQTFNPKENQLWIFTERTDAETEVYSYSIFLLHWLDVFLCVFITFSDFMSVLSGINNSLALFWLLQWLQGMSLCILQLSTCLFWISVESLTGSIQVVMCFYLFWQCFLIAVFNLFTFKVITDKKGLSSCYLFSICLKLLSFISIITVFFCV